MATIILKILFAPYNNTIHEKEIDSISADLAKSDIIYLTLNSLRYVSTENIHIVMALITRLVFSPDNSKEFGK